MRKKETDAKMGFFSKLCVKSNLPVMADLAGFPELSEIVALLPNGSKIAGTYDGYGRINDISLYESFESFDKIKFVLKSRYANESYADLPQSRNDPGQGWFHDDETLLKWMAKGGFATYGEFMAAYNNYEPQRDTPQ